MAAGLEQFKSDFLTCQICMEDCVNPKLLDCLHFFCEACLTKWKRNGRIECPTCRKVTTLKNDSTSSLKSMFFVSSMLDAIKDKLKESGTASGSGKGKFTEARCSDHGERLNFYCQTCSKPVCRDCIVLGHPRPSHLCVELSVAAAEARADIEKGMDKIVAIQTQLAVTEGNLKAGEDDVDASAAVAEVEMTKMYDGIVKAFKSKRDQISSKIQNLATSKKLILSTKQTEIASRNQTLSRLAGFLSNLQINGDDYDLANSHADVLKKAEEISAVEVPGIPKEISHIEFMSNTVYVEQLKLGFWNLGLVVDQPNEGKEELEGCVTVEVSGESKLPQDVEASVKEIIREAYTMEEDKLPQRDTQLSIRRAMYINNKLDKQYDEGWLCIIGCDFSGSYNNYSNLAQQFIVNNCEEVFVFHQLKPKA